jgi:hypothetical protein
LGSSLGTLADFRALAIRKWQRKVEEGLGKQIVTNLWFFRGLSKGGPRGDSLGGFGGLFNGNRFGGMAAVGEPMAGAFVFRRLWLGLGGDRKRSVTV